MRASTIISASTFLPASTNIFLAIPITNQSQPECLKLRQPRRAKMRATPYNIIHVGWPISETPWLAPFGEQLEYQSRIYIITVTKKFPIGPTSNIAGRNCTSAGFILVIHFVKNPIAYIFAIENRKYQYVNTNILFPLPLSW